MGEIIMLSEKEALCLKKTRLRNLRRSYAKLIQHPELTNECLFLHKEIKQLENELN